MIKALQDNNVDVNLTQIGQVQQCNYYKEYVTKAHNNYRSFDKNNPSLVIFHDEYLHQSCGNPIIAYSIFETTKLSERALYNLNNVADRVFTTTKEHKEILIDNGVTTPIFVVPEGVDPELYNTSGNKYIETGKPTYITVGKCEERKNTDMIIRSFVETMQYKECALIAHTYNVFTTRFMCEKFNFEALGFKRTENGNWMLWSNGICDIYFTKPISDIKKMKSLYLSANVGIAYSRAEGWDLPCHLSGTKIITNTGVKNIEDVTTKDKLLTHKGNFKNVLIPMKKKNKHDIYNIKCFGNVSTINATQDHPIYCIKKSNIDKYRDMYYIEPEWVKAKDIRKGDVIIKSIPKEIDTNTIIDLTMLDKNLCYNNEHVWYKESYNTSNNQSYTSLSSKYNTTKGILEKAFKHICLKTNPKKGYETEKIYNLLIKDKVQPKENIKFNRYIDIKDISKLIGLYIAEGSKDKSKIVFTIHEKEEQECLSMITKQNCFLSDDNNIWTKKHKDSKAVDICISGKILSILMCSLCGENAHTKRIPYQLLYGDISSLKNLTDWAVYGDGYINNNIVSYTTVSKQLRDEITIAFERFGYIPKISYDNRGVYTIWYNSNINNMSKNIKCWYHKYGIAKLVHRVTKNSEYNGYVYNFSVDTDNSYTLCNGTTHNCMELMACGIPTIASNVIGHSEYLPGSPKIQQDLIVEPIGKELAQDGVWFHGDKGDWYTMNKDDLSEKLEETFDDIELYSEPSVELSEYYHTNYNWSLAALKIREILEV